MQDREGHVSDDIARTETPVNCWLLRSIRATYKGGLVFEPKRGLWDRFILVMDFNSLYPSIIQEYNIDFTTVEAVEDEVRVISAELMMRCRNSWATFAQDGEEKIPEPPSSEVALGVLPRLIATLVNRRRQVKSLMKDKKATAGQLLQVRRPRAVPREPRGLICVRYSGTSSRWP